VVRTVPADGATGVPTGTPIEIEFSEEMARDTVERSLAASAPASLGSLRWSGRTVTAAPPGGLPDSTTVEISLAATAQDYHGVAAAAWSFAFSTGPVLDTGIVTGAVSMDAAPVAGAVVWLSAGPAAEGPGAQRAARATVVTGADGAFRFERVRARAGSYSVIAFVDADRDGEFDVGEEAGAVLEGAALVVAPGDSVGGVAVTLTPPARGEGAEE
jgi:hypothetical protein